MKKFYVAILMFSLIPLATLAADAPSVPSSSTVSVDRLTVKPVHLDAFKAGMVAHQKKYHTGKWAWRVSEILSGPDQGDFQIVEGPNSWTDMEDRGDLAEGHQKDYDKNILAHIQTSKPTTYMTFNKNLSTVASNAYSDVVVNQHLYVKPFKGGYVSSSIKMMSKAWEKMGWTVAVWSADRSGQNHYAISYRLPEGGLKNFDKDGPSTRETFDSIHGAGSYSRTLEILADSVDKEYYEITRYNKDISSK